MIICTVNSTLAQAFRRAGHEVHDLRPKPGLYSLPELLEATGVRPDLVFQQEILSRRVLLADLDKAPCPTVFWSVDTHLNLWWHGLYGRAFDLVLTTQSHLVSALTAMGVARAGHLPWYGVEAPFRPFAERPRDMVFVGRVTELRPARKWMLDFLGGRFDLEHRLQVPYDGVVEALGDGRLTPNESILGEINFRLFEAASAGCAVLNQDLDGLPGLFEPGREVAVYRDVLDMETQARELLDDPSRAESMGRAARERVLSAHLPGHRASAVVRDAQGLAPSRPDRRRDAAWRQGVGLAFEAGLVPIAPQRILDLLGRRADDAGVLATLVRITAESGDRQRTASAIKPLVASPAPGPLELDLAASTAALHIGWTDGARQVLERHKGLRPGRGPADARGILLAWCDLLEDAGRTTNDGFPFKPDVHLPVTALQCLFASRYDPMDEAMARRMHRLAATRPGLEMLDMGALSTLTLHHGDDWRLDLELALINLRSFRRDQGLDDLAAALDKARAAGQENAFVRLLEALDGQGRALETLGITRTHDAQPT